MGPVHDLPQRAWLPLMCERMVQRYPGFQQRLQEHVGVDLDGDRKRQAALPADRE